MGTKPNKLCCWRGGSDGSGNSDIPLEDRNTSGGYFNVEHLNNSLNGLKLHQGRFLELFLCLKCCKTLDQASQGRGGITNPEVSKTLWMWHCVSDDHVGLGPWVNFMILKVFSSMSDSMNP